jgi:hypothetical protein
VDTQLRASLHRIAAAGGAVIVAASASERWDAVKARFVTVLGHGHSGREQVQAELLEETNQAIGHAPAGLLDQIVRDQLGRAQQLLLQAMIVDPSVGGDLEQLILELDPPAEEEDPEPPPPRPGIPGRPVGARWL